MRSERQILKCFKKLLIEKKFFFILMEKIVLIEKCFNRKNNKFEQNLDLLKDKYRLVSKQ
jgi:hypothetical protein